MTDLRLDYTLCFLTRGDAVLMLHRLRPPNRGLWNGVGGHIEADESPLAACLREVREETGYRLHEARFAGLLTWTGFETADGGVYLFTAQAPQGEPAACPEGALRWQPRSWLLSSAEVVSNIRHYGPEVLAGGGPAAPSLRIPRRRNPALLGRGVAARAASRVRCAPTWSRRPPRGRGSA
ncbi:MAG TPA: 8-oxo-dGTP diphosphatase [Burkholderiales bacterium]|nr:8-oxo-dGTP diphosphatase [Burkholderiales bacterium]